MQIIAAIEYDRLRKEPDSWNKVFLHREGKFYRAYEWSAWLLKTVVCTEEMQQARRHVVSDYLLPCRQKGEYHPNDRHGDGKSASNDY